MGLFGCAEMKYLISSFALLINLIENVIDIRIGARIEVSYFSTYQLISGQTGFRGKSLLFSYILFFSFHFSFFFFLSVLSFFSANWYVNGKLKVGLAWLNWNTSNCFPRIISLTNFMILELDFVWD